MLPREVFHTSVRVADACHYCNPATLLARKRGEPITTTIIDARKTKIIHARGPSCRRRRVARAIVDHRMRDALSSGRVKY